MDYDSYIKIDDGTPISITNLKVFAIGRVRDLRLRIPKFIINDKAVSATHCTISVCSESSKNQPFFWVWDGNGKVGSKNKTIVNGSRQLDGDGEEELRKGCKIYHGDYLLIANHKITFLVIRRQRTGYNGTF